MNTTKLYNIDVDILVNGKPIKQYTHESKIFIEAKEGTEYEINIKNNNYSQIECVVGVDGLDVITGDAATEKSTGYIIDSRSKLKLKGYRISDDQVSAFKFCKSCESYAQTKTIAAQNGVITITCYNKVFELPDNIWKIADTDIFKYKPTTPWEAPPMQPVWYYQDYTTCNTAPDFGHIKTSNDNIITSCNMPIPTSEFNAGTTFGSVKESKVTEVLFSRGAEIGELNIYYTFKDGLRALGIDTTEKQKVVFPQGKTKYCQPPSNWKG